MIIKVILYAIAVTIIVLCLSGCTQKVKEVGVVEITPAPKGLWYVTGGDIYYCETNDIGNYCSKFPKEYYNELFRGLKNAPR